MNTHVVTASFSLTSRLVVLNCMQTRMVSFYQYTMMIIWIAGMGMSRMWTENFCGYGDGNEIVMMGWGLGNLW